MADNYGGDSAGYGTLSEAEAKQRQAADELLAIAQGKAAASVYVKAKSNRDLGSASPYDMGDLFSKAVISPDWAPGFDQLLGSKRTT
jgi:hypothetical protein